MKNIVTALIVAVALTVTLDTGAAHAAPKPKPKGTISASLYKKLPPCPYDEVTDFDCYWNAKKQGNGQGRSFFVIDGQIHYIR